MATLRNAGSWVDPDEEVFLVLIRREDTTIPEEHWGMFIEECEMNGKVWEKSLDELEADYENIWKEDNVCDKCNNLKQQDCECEDELEDTTDE